MNISLTQPALHWFKREMNLEKGQFVRFYVRFGGYATNNGFSIGLTMNDTPIEPAATLKASELTFFIEQKDAWFFDGKDLKVKYSRTKQEIEYVLI
ncbi:hypothetical protein GCM10012290_04470 [Halolactibacillus alkaliphilus]|uniref:FeS cluster biogenesis domain-containing protein n=1 Tax=Halolactibacillus alkaliphilus TaxID=442899 RepID=A0A511WXS8_9BACI|nr:hypothetical protein [Halolactibacillus alkaliphilus]GEN55919.1 hypothetical protein HAL01_03830 [Halolactibacillus alkaliphilus]GGN65599.1 hypothetical protein GCM10012290_04470 [Halolactibacillus alkaliphilus]SFO65884.1 Uncharacterized protein YneR [Halolactibacillus alkaliphilus]